MKTRGNLFFLLILILSVAGCGGGGGGGGAAPAAGGGGGGGGNNPPGNLNNLLTGNYFVVIGAVGAQDATIFGTVAMDGAGGITGVGPLTVRTNQGVANANLTAGVYNVDNNRNTTSTVSTNVLANLQQQFGRTSADGNIAIGVARDGQGTVAFVILLRRANVTSVAGTLLVNLGFVTPGASGVGGGTLVFDANGNITGGQLTDAQGVASNITGGVYTLDGNGGINATVNLANARTFTVTGAVNLAGTGALVFNDGQGDFGFGLASPALMGASNGNLNGSLGVFTLQVAGGTGYAGGSAVFNGAGAITSGQATADNGQTATLGGNYAVAGNGTAQVNVVIQGAVTLTVNGHVHISGNVTSGTGNDTQGGVHFSALVP